jgi:translocation and assembly module TamB
MRWMRRIGLSLIGIILLVIAVLFLADTQIGHRFIANKIAAQAPKSGLKISIGRIDGSIYGKAQLKVVRLTDPHGLFFETSEAQLDWTPASWLSNRLDITSLILPAATLHRLPKLRPSSEKRPILPRFDIHIGQLDIQRLLIKPAIAGQSRIGHLSGTADVRAGRALIKFDADAAAGDKLALNLDADPDRNRFDLDADLSAPAGGVFGAIIGTARPVGIRITGDGSWTQWQGSGLAAIAGKRVADLALTANRGTFGLNGRLFLEPITHGKVQRLTAPVVRINGTTTLANRRLKTKVTFASSALAVNAAGTVDLASNRFDPLDIDARLLQPSTLFPNMTGQNVALKMQLTGPFAMAGFDYLLTAPFVAFDQTGFEQVRATGQGRLSPSPVTVPIKLTARRVTGVGDVAGGILANLAVDGQLRVTSTLLTGDGLILKSDKLSGKLTVLVDLLTGRFDVGLAGQLARYFIPGVGIVDVKSELNVVPGENGHGSRVSGHGHAWVRRFDNVFLAGLAGGLPVLDTKLVRGTDGIIRFVGLKLTAPGISLFGNGYRRLDGSFQFEGSGRQARYGPISQFLLDGRIERPKLDMVLARPNETMGLSNVHLAMDPDASGYVWRANGGSLLGPFIGNGTLLLPKTATATISIATLDLSGMKASGSLRPRGSGLEGRLTLAGSGVNGTLDLGLVGVFQQIEAHLKARDARLEGPPVLSARRGSFDGVILLDPAGTSVEGTVTGQGMARGGLTLARLAANVKMKGGVGEVRASFAGSRGRIFDFQTLAQISPSTIRIVGTGSVDRKPMRLTTPAILTREAGGWRMAPTALEFAGGQAKLSGLFGAASTELDANVTQVPLAILDIFYPRLGLGGSASGLVTYRQPSAGSPSGKADVRIRGLTRSGLVLSSRPVDVGLTAILSAGNAAARGVAVSGGQVIGRGQIQLTPSGGGDLYTRLASARMFAQVRFSGAADTLWRLTGIEGFDVSGPVAIGADIVGTPNAPIIKGSMRTTNARVESPITGMILSGVNASGQFGGSRLVIDNFTGTAGSGGRVSGHGSFDLAAKYGTGMNLTLNADHAVLIARDDLGATVTGPLTLVSEGNGGVISGDLQLDRSLFRLGRATAASAVPHLNVREINGISDEAAPLVPVQPWRFALKAHAPSRLSVTGLGIESEWKADLEIGGTLTAPTMRGQANLIHGGYDFAGRRFDLTRGTIRFQGESPPDPILDIAANGDTQGLTASIRVTGTGQRPDISFASSPALPQDELLSRLLFGTSITNLSAPEAVQLAAAVAALQSGNASLNPLNVLRNAIGLDRLRILPADTVTGQKTAIAVGKYLTRRTYVEIITDGQGYSATRAEFQITRWLSLLSSISTIGRQTATVRVSKDY